MKHNLKSFAATVQLFALACLLTSPVQADNSPLNNCKRTVNPDEIIPQFLNAPMDCTIGGNAANPVCIGKGCIVRELVRNGCQECAYDDSLSWLTFPCDELKNHRFLEWAEYAKPCYFARDGYLPLQDLSFSVGDLAHSGRHGAATVSGRCECDENPDRMKGPFPNSKQCSGAVCAQSCTF